MSVVHVVFITNHESLETMSILVIEDNPEDIILIKNNIKTTMPNCDIVIVKTGQEGIEALNTHEFSCVFIDYRLPDLTGIDVLKHIYDPLTGLPPYPCILLTAENDQSIFMEAMGLGAQDYLLKSQITSDALLLIIEKAKNQFNLQNEKNEISRKYAHAQKIEAMGQLTGGIAHDFNNLLTVILGNTQLATDQLTHGSPDKDYLVKKLNSIHKSAQKGADLIQHLMTFSGQRGLNTSPLNINDIILGMKDLLIRTIGKTVHFNHNFIPDLWLSNIDRSELEHLLINMCANARDAMPDGGNITLSTKNIDLSNHDARLIGLKSGSYICLSITDTGTGIAKQHLDKIFDPFFTTKDVGKGTGLGMSTSFTFVRDCGGIINVQSEIGTGTSFDIYFPKCDSELALTAPPPPIKHTTQGHGTILVTEDEPEILELAVMILQSKGYTTLEAGNADEALAILQDTDIYIDLLFTDIVMPGDMNGVGLAARALVLRPDLKILFTTGFIKDNIPDMNLLEEYTVLNKPYMPDDLIEEIQQILVQ